MNVYLYAYKRTTKPSAGILHGTMEADSLSEVLESLNDCTSDDGGEIISIAKIDSL